MEENGSKNKKEETLDLKLSNIEKLGGATTENNRNGFQCISIIGQIEGHYVLPDGQKATKYEHLLPLLVSVEEDRAVDGLLVLLNTMGGDVEAGLAIAEVIASMRKPTVSLVLGGSHSIGVPLATAARRSLIVPSATMTLHPVRVNGTVIGVPQSFRYMSEMQNRIIRFICSHSHADAQMLSSLMMRPDQIATDCGSVLEAEETVKYGIIDEVGGLDRALDLLPIISSVFNMLAVFQRDEQKTRFLVLCNASLFCAYYIIIGSTSLLAELLAAVTSLAALIKYRKKA